MRSYALAVLMLALCSAGASAQSGPFVPCHAPLGLTPNQWYAMCGGAVQQDYREGYGGGMSFEQYAQMLYQGYARSVAAAPPAAGRSGGGGSGAGMQCNPGAVQCFNHYMRTCQLMPGGNASWWMTSGRSC